MFSLLLGAIRALCIYICRYNSSNGRAHRYTKHYVHGFTELTGQEEGSDDSKDRGKGVVAQTFEIGKVYGFRV